MKGKAHQKLTGMQLYTIFFALLSIGFIVGVFSNYKWREKVISNQKIFNSEEQVTLRKQWAEANLQKFVAEYPVYSAIGCDGRLTLSIDRSPCTIYNKKTETFIPIECSYRDRDGLCFLSNQNQQ